ALQPLGEDRPVGRRVLDQQNSSHVVPAPRSGVDVRSDRAQQLFTCEWLGEVLLGADDPAARLVEKTVLGGQHDHWRRLELLVALDQRAGLVPVEPRHHDVDEDDLRLLVGDLRQGLEAVAGGDHLAAFALEQRFSRPPDGLGVIDHHDPQAAQCPVRGRVVSHYPTSPCARRFWWRHCEGLYIPVRQRAVKPGLTALGSQAVAREGPPAILWRSSHSGPAGSGARMAAPLDVIVVMDPIGSIKIAKDTTFAMLLEAQRRGHRLHYVRPGGLSLRDGRALAWAAPLAVRDDKAGWYELGGFAELPF